MTNIQALRKLDLSDEANEFIDAIETEIEDLNDALKDAEQELVDAEDKITNAEEDRDSANSELASLEDEIEKQTIILSGGKIHIDLSDLDYLTRESFKSWCRAHAIANSEPVFNL